MSSRPLHTLCKSCSLAASNIGGRRAQSLRSISTGHSRLSSNAAALRSSSRGAHAVSRPRASRALDKEPLSPRTRYQQLVVQSGTLREDADQQRIIEKLQRLHEQLIDYEPVHTTPQQTTQPSWFGGFLGRNPRPPVHNPVVPKGLYLYGDVGTGKSMLMDLFYDTLPPKIKKKRRVHFHAFMIDVHKRLHELRSSSGRDHADPVHTVAQEISDDAAVLCFDEFQVTDIVDAMILRRLFECLIENGVVCVMTSNRHPDELYKNGIQRESFVPCINLIKEQFDVTDLNSGTDYRRIPRALSHVYYSPLTEANRSEVDKVWKALTHDEEIVHNRQLEIWGRKLTIPESTSKIARFTFHELCGKPLSAADYIEITKTFSTIFVLEVPKMDFGQKDLARRFITFIDACYESKTKLLASSEVPIYQVFSDESKSTEITDNMRQLMDDMGLSGDLVGSSPIFTGEEEVFAFARACSRLVQMGTREWAETAHA
ncbi:AFG1-like ATPase [Sistotremastrum niveocremeum HHB9708]|uniref:AFG1-like ATPase n=1 Tax=Sistotremastrum niveocremeum HHB9708 TaxID=1314777 RepID=A0A164ZUA8_9AGAM|nr:AFG1-like ATPase [Sistotremastrum niveocremeum HHB9708]